MSEILLRPMTIIVVRQLLGTAICRFLAEFGEKSAFGELAQQLLYLFQQRKIP